MRSWCGVVTGAFCLLAAGCAGNDLLVKKQMEMEVRLEQLAQVNVAANGRITDLTNQVLDLQKQVKTTNTELDALKPSHNELKASVELIFQKIAPLTPAVVTPKIEVVNSEADVTDKDTVHQNAYMQAFGLFSANNYSGAIEAFDLFVKSYPDSEYAGNAVYWLGECYYTQHNYSRALESFSKVVDSYPKGNKVPDAMLKIGYSLISMKEPAKAKAALQSLLEKYPKSPAAAKARERLGRI